MRCRLCHDNSDTLLRLTFYTRKGVWVCSSCYDLVERHKAKPYSRVMERLAMAEAGYHINRKRRR